MADRFLLPSDLSPSHYSLTLTPDLETLEYTCVQQIAVDVNKETSEVTLHSKEIYVQSVSFTSSNSTTKCVEISYNTMYNTVKFVFDSLLPIGEGVLDIKFRGILNGDMAGFYKSTYTDANGKKKIVASTQFEALDARRAFPCWDEPGVKATFSVTLIIPAHLTALSNMPELSCTHIPGSGVSKKKVVFHTSPKMSTYLLAWAVGEFDYVQATTKGGVSIRVFSPPGRAEQGLFALDVGVRCLDFYDDFFQVPYPLPKLDMICITEFAMGAMENWGLVTYRETALMIDEAKASTQQKQRVAIVVAHELAHQWFGNLVTMEWWDGLWLNEGFAAFMEHFAVDALFPDYEIWEQYTTDSFAAAQRLDALKSSHPIIVPIKHAEEVEQVFDAISYCKGSTVVNMVAAIIGADKFKEGLSLYMSRHAYGNTETIDLWNAWSEVSGKDIAKLMNTWTTETGYPYVKVTSETWTADSVEITLEQSRFLSDGSTIADSPLWCIPLLFSTEGSTSLEAVIMDRKVQTFSIPLIEGSGANNWIKINTSQKALVRVAHSPEMVTRLQKAIKDGALSAVDRSALLLDSYALAEAGLAPLETVVDILRALKDETSSTVWKAMAIALGALHKLLEQVGNAQTMETFTVFGKTMVTSALAQVGWDAKDTDTHTEKLLRATVISLLDTFAWNDEEVAGEARRRFDESFTNPAVLPSEYKGIVYRIVLMNGGAAEYETILKTAYTDTEDNQIRVYAMNTLGASNDPELKKRTLDWAMMSGEVKMQDCFYPVGSVANNAAGADMAWGYFQDNFDYIKDKLSKASPSLMDAVIVNSVSRFCTDAKADEIEEFFKVHPLPSSERRISQTLERMRTTSQMLETLKKSPLMEAEYWV